MMTFKKMKYAAREFGNKWFTNDSFFATRYEHHPIPLFDHVALFITSERFEVDGQAKGPRGFALRSFDETTGQVRTFSGLCAFETKRDVLKVVSLIQDIPNPSWEDLELVGDYLRGLNNLGLGISRDQFETLLQLLRDRAFAKVQNV